MKDLTLFLVQMRSVLGETETNLESIIGRIKDLGAGSDMICFPESSLTGYTSDRPRRFSLSASDERIEAIRRAADEKDIAVVFGFLEHKGHDHHVTQAVADGRGGLSLYRKTHLGRNERRSFMPGGEIRTIHTPKAELGIQLCWESHFPEISSKQRKEGAEVILISYASPIGGPRRKDIWMRHVPARSSDNCVFAGVVNAVGDSGETLFGGGSMVFDPKGNVIGEYFGTNENVLTVDLFSEEKDALGSDDDMGKIDYFRYRREELY